MFLYVLVGIGGALGSIARFWLNGLISAQVGELFPWGTLIVNVTGSFVIGFIATIGGPDGRWFMSAHTRSFLTIGVCGGYTTFSSFSLQTLNLARNGEWMRAGGYTVGSVVACLAGVWLGHLCASALNQMK